MKKLIQGIIDFRKNLRPQVREAFARLALGQKPDALLICCSDSRVAPNVFASTDPGDLFVVRNVGNLVPRQSGRDEGLFDTALPAALEFAVLSLDVKHIIVCGHSECGAMKALCTGHENIGPPHLRSWLVHGLDSVQRLEEERQRFQSLSQTNALSKINVLQQLAHLRSYSFIEERLMGKTLKLHGWWFDIQNAEVQAYHQEKQDFVLVDETYGAL